MNLTGQDEGKIRHALGIAILYSDIGDKLTVTQARNLIERCVDATRNALQESSGDEMPDEEVYDDA